MSADVSRRNVLKAGALAGAASILGWHLPGAAPKVGLTGDPVPPITLPEMGQVVEVQLGKLVTVSPFDIAHNRLGWAALKKYAYDKLDGEIATWPEGWELLEPVTGPTHFEMGPGADHHDPLAEYIVLGAKQTWRARRIA